jgi:hypothetical protein
VLRNQLDCFRNRHALTVEDPLFEKQKMYGQADFLGLRWIPLGASKIQKVPTQLNALQCPESKVQTDFLACRKNKSYSRRILLCV